MLIVISGLIGVGKTTVAKELSKRMSIPFYSIDEDKKRIYKTHPQHEYFFKNHIPFPDEIRKKTFDASLDGLRKLHKKHKYAIVDETFHKKSLREPFFEEAKKIFGGIMLILVKLDDKFIKERLDKRDKEEDHLVGYGMYLSFKKQWEHFENVDYEFVNEGNFDKNLDNLMNFIRKKLNLSNNRKQY